MQCFASFICKIWHFFKTPRRAKIMDYLLWLCWAVTQDEVHHDRLHPPHWVGTLCIQNICSDHHCFRTSPVRNSKGPSCSHLQLGRIGLVSHLEAGYEAHISRLVSSLQHEFITFAATCRSWDRDLLTRLPEVNASRTFAVSITISAPATWGTARSLLIRISSRVALAWSPIIKKILRSTFSVISPVWNL